MNPSFPSWQRLLFAPRAIPTTISTCTLVLHRPSKIPTQNIFLQSPLRIPNSNSSHVTKFSSPLTNQQTKIFPGKMSSGPPRNPRIRRLTDESPRQFENFFEDWLVRQEHLLDEIRSTLQTCDESREEHLRDLIGRVLAHYQQYYEEKSRMANRNVFLVFSPTWFTPFERTFFWIAGFKPGLAFRIVRSTISDLSVDQGQQLERLVEQTKAEEKELTNELARIQESVAAPPLMSLAWRAGRTLIDGEVDAAMKTFRAVMEGVLSSADMLRTRTAERVVEILTPAQNVKFLAAATELQRRIRIWGLQKEAERRSRAW